MLKREKARTGRTDDGGDGGDEAEEVREREWVLPTHLREKWSLRKFADVFDAVEEEPPEPGPDDVGDGAASVDGGEVRNGKTGGRRGGKRVLLATVDTDSTVVYYIVHEGIVKPRQN